MKKVLYPILVIVLFLVVQSFAGIGVAIFGIIKDPDFFHQMNGGDPNQIINKLFSDDSLAWALIISDIVIVGIIALLKMINWKTVLNFRMIEWKWGSIGIMAAVFGIFVLDIMAEWFQLPNEMEGVFNNLSNSLVGALSIAILGPIAEEFIFREGILGYMLRSGMNKWVAITASALVFGIIHLNPAQVPFAAGIGFIFGIIYYRTGNIVITSILHILNNSTAVLLMVLQGEEAEDTKLGDLLGGPVMSLAICIPLLAVGVNCLRVFWKESRTEHFPTPQPEQTETILITQETETTNQNLINDETVL
jgi:membrane protease YdiL (CAAX protease family)